MSIICQDEKQRYSTLYQFKYINKTTVVKQNYFEEKIYRTKEGKKMNLLIHGL